jgi:NAD(P)H-dependent FMN reductase
LKLEIIIASTRPGRLGDQIGKWIADYAAAQTDFQVAIADLAEIDLPMYDEPGHPMTGVYEKDHTKAWSKRIGAADAFVVVTPEYNRTMPPALLNAVDFLHHEWKHKPVGFVGYGGTGAVRAIQTEKLLFANLSTMPIAPVVELAGVFRPVTTTFVPEEKHIAGAGTMLAELHAWAVALAPMHAEPALAA